MGRVRDNRYVGAAVLLALVAVLVLFARGDNGVEATTFEPVTTVLVADPTPGANSSVTTTTTTPLTDSQFSGLDYITFYDSAWGIATDADIPNGSIVGSSVSFAKLGALNSFCGFITFPAIVAFLEATTDTSGPLVDFEDTDANGVGEWFEAPDGSVLSSAPPPDIRIRRAINEYPSNLVALFPEPRMRFFGYLALGTTDVGVNLLFFDPGDLPEHSADQGFPIVLTIQRLGDPLDLGDPGSPLTDFCNLQASLTTNGSAGFNPFTGATPFPPNSIPVLTNPKKGDYDFPTFFRSQRDADNDGTSNDLDTCPVSTNLDGDSKSFGTPVAPFFITGTGDPDGFFDADFTDTITADDVTAPEGIDSACDADPSSPCGPGPFDNFNFAAVGGMDCDLDASMNRTDNCPQVFNPTQADTDTPFGTPAVDAGPGTDAIGDACDTGGPAPGLSATVPNGHYHLSASASGSGPHCTLTPTDTCGPWDTLGLADDVEPLATPSFPFPGSAYVSSPISIADHGVELKRFTGPKEVASGSTNTYEVTVKNENKVGSQDIPVALRVVEDCGTVTQTSASATGVAKKKTAVVTFTVDFSGCADGPVTLQADACHAGDPVPAGFFGDTVLPCPGSDPHGVGDAKPLDDVPETIDVDVGG